jgi:hypothetical protein
VREEEGLLRFLFFTKTSILGIILHPFIDVKGMNQSDFQSAAWYNATTLTERIALLSNMSSGCCQMEINHTIAQHRIQIWKSTSSFNQTACWSKRLAKDGITEDQFIQILGEPIQRVQNYFSTPPDWLTEITEAFARTHVDSIPLSDELSDPEAAGFLNVFEPFINQGRDPQSTG